MSQNQPLPVPMQQTAAVAQPGRVGQATAVEQSRAIAEVQAAIVVAQQCPRDINRARTEMQTTCGMMHLAEMAFYRYKRGGQAVSGPSIHLARELARCWGNMDWGISEMRRDDVAGESEMKAWAWDQQTNARDSRTFIVKHQRDKKGGAERLTDQRDIYENNTNMAARRLRETIFAILPRWFTEEAQEICGRTLQAGDGKALEERIEGAIAAFAGFGVDVARLEQKLGRSVDKWSSWDIAQLRITHRSLERGEVTVEDEFPQRRVTVDELTEPAIPTETSSPEQVTADAEASAEAEQQTLRDSAGVEYDPNDPERPFEDGAS